MEFSDHSAPTNIFSAYMRNREILARLEAATGLGPTKAARLLGMPYVSYAQARSGLRQLKLCHVYHVEVLLLLDRKQLQRRIREIVQ
jgi:hypothetical protein